MSCQFLPDGLDGGILPQLLRPAFEGGEGFQPAHVFLIPQTPSSFNIVFLRMGWGIMDYSKNGLMGGSSMISEAKPELVSTRHGGAILRRRRKGFAS